MKTGRPPKPPELHVLEGTFRKDRHEAPAAPQAAGEPVCPARLKGEARKFWAETVSRLVALGIAKEADTAALASLCEWWARYRKFSTALDKVGADNKGAGRLVDLAKKTWEQFDKLAARFGLTPADRTRLRVGDAPRPAGVMTRKRNA